MLSLGLRIFDRNLWIDVVSYCWFEASSLLPYKTGGRSTGMVRLLHPVVAAFYLELSFTGYLTGFNLLCVILVFSNKVVYAYYVLLL